MVGEHHQDEWTRTYRCRDAAGRDRTLIMFLADDGAIALKAPPGETAVVPVDQMLQLREDVMTLFPEAQRRGMRRRP